MSSKGTITELIELVDVFELQKGKFDAETILKNIKELILKNINILHREEFPRFGYCRH